MAYIHKNIHAAIYADPSNAALWVDGSYAADLTVFQNVRGTYDGGSPITVPGVGNADTRTINADRNVSVDVQGIKGNEGFWDDIKNSQNYYLAIVVGGDYDLLMKVYIPTTADVGKYINDRLLDIDGIERSLTTMTYKVF